MYTGADGCGLEFCFRKFRRMRKSRMQLVNKTAAMRRSLYGMMLRLPLAGDKFFANGGSVDLVVFAISISWKSESVFASDLIYQSLRALLLSVSDCA